MTAFGAGNLVGTETRFAVEVDFVGKEVSKGNGIEVVVLLHKCWKVYIYIVSRHGTIEYMYTCHVANIFL